MQKIPLVYKFDHPDIGNRKKALEKAFSSCKVELLNIKPVFQITLI